MCIVSVRQVPISGIRDRYAVPGGVDSDREQQPFQLGGAAGFGYVPQMPRIIRNLAQNPPRRRTEQMNSTEMECTRCGEKTNNSTSNLEGWVVTEIVGVKVPVSFMWEFCPQSYKDLISWYYETTTENSDG